MCIVRRLFCVVCCLFGVVDGLAFAVAFFVVCFLLFGGSWLVARIMSVACLLLYDVCCLLQVFGLYTLFVASCCLVFVLGCRVMVGCCCDLRCVVCYMWFVVCCSLLRCLLSVACSCLIAAYCLLCVVRCSLFVVCYL